MEHTIIFVLASALVGLFFSRLHFHFSFDLTISRRGATDTVPPSLSRAKIRRAERAAESGAVRSISDPGVTKALEAAKESAEADLASALVNMGCRPPKAKEVAKEAMGKASDFDSRLKWAIQHAA